MPLPQSYYVSPLDRALHTAQLTFSSVATPPKHTFNPIVKELLREANGIHTCDRRSSRTYIASNYPAYYTIEPGFSEEDLLWVPDLRESDSAQTARLGELLDDVFSHDGSTFISMTSHGGAIAAILRVVGHRRFSLRTGAVLPVLLRVERVSGEKPKMEIEPWKPKPKCSY
jgi:broad specificity phosphatase PhoE